MKSSPKFGNGGTRFWGQFQDDPDKCIYYCSLGGYKECSGKNKSTDQLYYCWGGEVILFTKFVRFLYFLLHSTNCTILKVFHYDRAQAR